MTAREYLFDELSFDGVVLQSMHTENSFEQPPIFTRPEVAEQLKSESALRFLEVARDVPKPCFEEEIRLTAWMGLGSLALEAYRGQWQPLETVADERASLSILARLTVPQAEALGYLLLGEDNLSIEAPKLYAQLGVSNRDEAIRVGSLSKGITEQGILQMAGPHIESLAKMEIESRLSERQLQVLSLAAQRKSSTEIATELKINIKTVYSHWQRIKNALEVKSKSEALAMISESPVDIKTREKLFSLSKKQNELLSLAAQEKTIEEIMTAMDLTHHAFCILWVKIQSKLEVETRKESIAMLPDVELKVLEPGDFYKLTLQGRNILLGLSQGLSTNEVDKKMGINSASSLTKIRKSLGIKTTLMLELTAQANREVIEAAKNSWYHRAELNKREVEYINLALQGLSSKKISEIIDIREEAVDHRKQTTLKKLNASSVFKASLLLDPPRRELVEDLDLSELGGRCKERYKRIFLRMADNPTSSELAKEFSYSKAKYASAAVQKIQRALHVPNRLQLARLSYAYRQHIEEINREKQEELPRQRLEESFRCIVSPVVEKLIQAEKRQGQPEELIKVANMLENAGLACDPELINEEGKARLPGMAAALLLKSKYGPKIRDPEFIQSAVKIIKTEVYRQREYQSHGQEIN